MTQCLDEDIVHDIEITDPDKAASDQTISKNLGTSSSDDGLTPSTYKFPGNI